MTKNKLVMTLSTLMVSTVLMSACSQQVQSDPTPGSKTSRFASVAHTHLANKCTNTVTHSHPNGGTAHKHRYSCQPNVPKSKNTHTHPTNKCTNSTTHTHPNGKHKHAHRYSCQTSNTGYKGNAHIHPANSKTRSIRHVHPNGNTEHTHNYGG